VKSGPCNEPYDAVHTCALCSFRFVLVSQDFSQPQGQGTSAAVIKGLSGPVLGPPIHWEFRVCEEGAEGKREEVAGSWRTLPHNEELHNLYASSNFVGVKSRRVRWAGNVA